MCFPAAFDQTHSVLFCWAKVHGEGEGAVRSFHVNSRETQSERAGSVASLPELWEVAGPAEVHGCVNLLGARSGALCGVRCVRFGGVVLFCRV